MAKSAFFGTDSPRRNWRWRSSVIFGPSLSAHSAAHELASKPRAVRLRFLFRGGNFGENRLATRGEVIQFREPLGELGLLCGGEILKPRLLANFRRRAGERF